MRGGNYGPFVCTNIRSGLSDNVTAVVTSGNHTSVPSRFSVGKGGHGDGDSDLTGCIGRWAGLGGSGNEPSDGGQQSWNRTYSV